MDKHDIVNAALPEEVIEGSILSKEETERRIQNVLKQVVPTCDLAEIKTDLKWQFVLGQLTVSKASRKKPKKTFLTRAQRKELGLLKLPENDWNYSSLKTMRCMWRDYMRENLDLVNKALPTCTQQAWNTFSVIVAKSEMVGADIKIGKSKVPSLIGMRGTVVLETKATFQIVTVQNKLKTILKEPSIFEFRLDNMKFTFLGKHLMSRPTDRSVRKIRNLMYPDL